MKVVGDVRINLQKTRGTSTTEKSLRFVLILGNCFGLFPVNGVTSEEKGLSFDWKSAKVVYSLVITLAAACTLIVGVISLTERSSFTLVAEYLFYVNWAVCLVLFLRVAKRWPRLMKSWSTVDAIMDVKYGKPQDLNRKLWIITAVLMTLAAMEHGLALGCHVAHCRYAYKEVDASTFYMMCFPNFFASKTYNNCLGVAIHLVSILATFTWTYNDLFIIAVSISLAVRFRQIRIALQKNQDKALPIHYWRDVREDYGQLSNLCLFLDECVAFNISTSFASNLFSVLAKLFSTLNDMEGWVQKVYFAFSFAFLLIRTVAVALYAAWINEESKEPASVLYSVPASTYNKEIQRFLMQISFDNVALTGNRMYKVTKGLILNVAGAIVTYELVLIQFTNTNTTWKNSG